MRTLILILAIGVLTNVGYSQKTAVTENGEEVVLYENGTWKYINDSINAKSEIPTNSNEFKKSAASTFLLKSKLSFGFWLNPKKWSFKKGGAINPKAEYEFLIKGGDLYGLALTEKVEVSLEGLKTIVVGNYKKVDPGYQIVKEEYRTVNGITVLMLQSKCTIKGMKISYYGYYYSSANGTVQLIVYTSQNLMSKYQKECEEFLNGLVEIK